MDSTLISIDRWQPQIDAFIAGAAVYTLELVVAAIILFVGNWASHRLAELLRGALEKMHTDATFTAMMCNFAKWGIRAIALIVALGQIGIATASMLTVLGTAGLAIGLALQGSLQNIAAGLMLLLWRPFRVGDFIEGAGAASGMVADISLFTTRLTRADGTMMFVPNSLLWGNPLTNITANPTRRISINITIGRQDDIELALGVLAEIVNADPRILQTPGAMPWIAVSDYTDLGIKLNTGVWTKSADYFPTQADLLRTIKPRLEDAGCVTPGVPVAIQMTKIRLNMAKDNSAETPPQSASSLRAPAQPSANPLQSKPGPKPGHV
ncbi:MAG: mechanosensitive ion channel family protein [Pseudomonas sp.]